MISSQCSTSDLMGLLDDESVEGILISRLISRVEYLELQVDRLQDMVGESE